MKELRICIVGMGIGKENGRGYLRTPRARIVALCDLIEQRMRDFAKEIPNPVKLYTDYTEMVKDSEIDAVFVGTPNQWHVPIALEAVKHDKHVIVTKPLADALEPARELVKAAESAGVVNMMSLSNRFSPPVRYMGEIARRGELGEIYYARARRVRRIGIPAWNLGFIQKGGGAFRDLGVHNLDAAWWLLGMPQPTSVLGVGGAKFGPRGQAYIRMNPVPPEIYTQFAADDYAGGFIRFANGSGLQIDSFWASHQPEERQIELFGAEGGARLDPLTVYHTAAGISQDIAVKLPEENVWDIIATHLVGCVLDGVPCSAPLRHGLIVQEMMEALLQSAETGREVRLG